MQLLDYFMYDLIFGDNFVSNYTRVIIRLLTFMNRTYFSHLFSHSRIMFFNGYNLLDFQRIIPQSETYYDRNYASSLLFAFAPFPSVTSGDWKLA